MTHHMGNGYAFGKPRLGGQEGHFLSRQAEARHPRVGVDVGGERGTDLAAEARPRLDLGKAVEHGDEVVVGEDLWVGASQSVEHVDRGLGQTVPQRDALANLGDEEGPAPGSGQGRSHPVHAKPVGVGLDDARALGARHHFPEQPVVGGNGVEIDGQDGAGVRRL